MKDRNFLGEFLLRQQAPQQPQQAIQQTPVVQDENAQLISALQQQPRKVAGTVPLAELDTREALAKSLLQQANDRNAHPLARGIAAFFGAKNLQEIGAERGRTQEAIAKVEAEKEALKAAEDKRRFEAEFGLKKETRDAAIEANKLERERQERLDILDAEDTQRRAALEERKLQLEEAKANQIISDKEAEAQIKQIEQEAAVIDGVASAEQTIQQIDELLAHPGFSGAVGAGFQKSIPFTGAGDIDKVGGGFAAGSDAASFAERLKQLKGGAFLEARQLLKGGGAISDTESNKAEAAQTRMSLAQSESEFKAAAKEYQGIIKAGLERQKEKAQKLGYKVPDVKADETPVTSKIKFLGFE